MTEFERALQADDPRLSGWDPSQATPDRDGLPDEAMVPFVEALLGAGITTLQSCSGHVDDAGRHDGELWFETDAFDPVAAAATGEFLEVTRRYARPDEPCWTVAFTGLAEGDATLARQMRTLFDLLGVDPPAVATDGGAST